MGSDGITPLRHTKSPLPNRQGANRWGQEALGRPRHGSSYRAGLHDVLPFCLEHLHESFIPLGLGNSQTMF